MRFANDALRKIKKRTGFLCRPMSLDLFAEPNILFTAKSSCRKKAEFGESVHLLRHHPSQIAEHILQTNEQTQKEWVRADDQGCWNKLKEIALAWYLQRLMGKYEK
ncbi:MAG TPA: hypothetical protein VK818_13870 [Methylomirabilota bacterium]|nr:hypothetical protein [Methylomirabilota bacterium]